MTQVLPIWDYVDVDKRLTFHVAMGNEATVTVTKDKDMFLFINFYQYININMFDDNLGSQISDDLPRLQAITSSKTSFKFPIHDNERKLS